MPPLRRSLRQHQSRNPVQQPDLPVKREEQGARPVKREEQEVRPSVEVKREDEIQDTIQHIDIRQQREIEAAARQRREQLEEEEKVSGRLDRIPQYFEKYKERCEDFRCLQGVKYFQECLEEFLALSFEEQRHYMGPGYDQFFYTQEDDWDSWAQHAKEEYEANPTPRARVAGNKRERFPWEMTWDMLWEEDHPDECGV